MTTQPNAVPESPLGSQAIAPTVLSPTRPLYWSIRRELWENRSIYIAPLARMSHSGGRGAATISSTR